MFEDRAAQDHGLFGTCTVCGCKTEATARVKGFNCSLRLSGLGGGRYAGYEHGRVIYSWEWKQQEAIAENVFRINEQTDMEKSRCEAFRQAVKQGNGARVWKVGLDGWCVA